MHSDGSIATEFFLFFDTAAHNFSPQVPAPVSRRGFFSVGSDSPPLCPVTEIVDIFGSGLGQRPRFVCLTHQEFCGQ